MLFLIGTKLHMQKHIYVYDCPTMTVFTTFTCQHTTIGAIKKSSY